MTAIAPLLVELLTEELPPRALARLADAFAQGMVERLNARALIGAADRAPVFERHATPRRLAVVVHAVRAHAPPQRTRLKVLPVSIALDAHSRPTPVLSKKLAALGMEQWRWSDLERAVDGKNEALFIHRTQAGATLTEGLQTALDEILKTLPAPKTMRYPRAKAFSNRVATRSEREDSMSNTASAKRHSCSVIGKCARESVQFVRPAHRLIALHGERIVPVTALGLSAGRTTLGHRFLSNGEIDIPHADAYVETLRDIGHVQVDLDARRAAIRAQLLKQAGDAHVLMPDALLDEVTALVEWPAVYAGRFDAAFLSLPPECLILTMQTHQKYFALRNASGALQPHFLLVSNLDTPTPEQIIAGNVRVVRARLADAQFFFKQDRKLLLAERAPQLDAVVYHRQLGSQWQRVKADLLTQMVGEFPELQGVMGQYYARLDFEPEEVARACAEHYQPRFSG